VKIPTATVASVVAEASQKMADPNYSAVMVGGFVQVQTATAQYLGAHEDEVGGTEQVINAIFHAALIGLCYQRANNRTIRPMTFDDLDHVSDGDTAERLALVQPALHEYLEANVESEPVKRVLRLVALAMDWVS
jgi:hypothetical protein